MSFRRRLTLFFLLIVVLPMVALAVLVVDVTGDANTGKADARLGAGLEAGISLYAERVAKARETAKLVARDPAIENALRSGQSSELQAQVRRIRREQGLEWLSIRGPTGRELASAGAIAALGRVEVTLRDERESRPLGSVRVAILNPRTYARTVKELTGRDVAVVGGRRTLASTLTGTRPDQDLPPTGSSADVEVAGEELRAAAAALPGADDRGLVLFGPMESGGVFSSSPVVAGVLAAFFAIALLFIVMLLRVLQGHVSAMLNAARGIGQGDFSRKVPVVGDDEMAGLAGEFNKMSDRLSAQMDQLRHQRVQLDRSVRRIGQAFASGLDRRALLEIVADTALSACDAEYGRIALRAEVGTEVEAGRSSDAMREAIATAEQSMGERRLGEARGAGAHALASPLRRVGQAGELVGVMAVARSREPFGESERDVFLYLVGQASASVENIALHELVSAQASTDELTGLANNRAFRQLAEKEAARAERFGHNLSLLMLDIDDFKQVNDRYGHLQGDEVLRTVGRILGSESRGVDEPARYGGEEFVVLLPETDVDGAAEAAERIRARVEREGIPRTEASGSLRVTASIGVASMPVSAGDLRELIAAADSALYAAKRAGKNRIERAPAGDEVSPLGTRLRDARTHRASGPS